MAVALRVHINDATGSADRHSDFGLRPYALYAVNAVCFRDAPDETDTAESHLLTDSTVSERDNSASCSSGLR